METVKFRVWNGKEMVYDIMAGKFGIFYVNPEKGDGLNTKDTACLSENTTKYPEGTPLMQFTGLLDKNGKEIYEGDIVDFGGLGVVKYDEDRFYVDCGNIQTRVSKQHKVIGNIYENPELLNQKGKKK